MDFIAQLSVLLLYGKSDGVGDLNVCRLMDQIDRGANGSDDSRIGSIAIISFPATLMFLNLGYGLVVIAF